jgi:hypothetical protein
MNARGYTSLGGSSRYYGAALARFSALAMSIIVAVAIVVFVDAFAGNLSAAWMPFATGLLATIGGLGAGQAWLFAIERELWNERASAVALRVTTLGAGAAPRRDEESQAERASRRVKSSPAEGARPSRAAQRVQFIPPEVLDTERDNEDILRRADDPEFVARITTGLDGITDAIDRYLASAHTEEQAQVAIAYFSNRLALLMLDRRREAGRRVLAEHEGERPG